MGRAGVVADMSASDTRFLAGRVVQVIAPAPFGGAETVVLQLLGSLAGVQLPTTTVALGVTDPSRHAWVCALREAGCDVQCPPPSRSREFWQLAELLRKPGLVAVHSHGYRADFAAFLARPRGLRWVSTAHGFTGGGARMQIYEGADRWLLRRADRVLAVSSRLQALLSHGRPADPRVQLVRNVPAIIDRPGRAEARAVLGLPADATLVAWVGRFSHEKGADRLPALFAAPELACSLALVGDGPLREPVLAGLAPLGHLDVQWLGVRRDIGRLLAAFDLLVLPSRTEGMPMVVLEAMAAGVPVAAFAVGDVGHAITERTGWCVAPDDLQALTAALTAALRDVSAREAKGAASRAYLAAHFPTHEWLAAHLTAYGLAGSP